MAQIFGRSSGDMGADRRFDFAAQLSGRGDFVAAADLLTQAIGLAPLWPPLHFCLGQALGSAGEPDKAATAYHAYLAFDPADHMGAGLKLALLGLNGPEAIMPASYITDLFDEYAPRFDVSLVDTLGYQVPQQIALALQNAAPARQFETMLDLGCGTGLAAEAIKDICLHKTGVDLSPGMMEQARRKGLYDTLAVASIEEYLDNCSPDIFDLVLCADVLIYIGALEAVFARLMPVMQPGALCAFSVQHLASGTYHLGADHRYAHSAAYIRAVTALYGLTILSETAAIARRDGAVNINGLIFVCLKPVE